MTAETAPAAPRRALTKWQFGFLAAGITAVVLVLAAYAAAGSYDSVWHLAAAHRVPLPRLSPVGLDGGLVGVGLLSVGFTWAGYRLPWLRFAGRIFALGTIAANAAAGWPDPVAVFLRIFAPTLLVIITEAVHAVLLARQAEIRDPVPLARWLLSPWPTFRLWRRMVLWRVNSYGEAVELELSRLRAIHRLTAHFTGRDWRKAAPPDLVWMLRRGVKMADALAMVAELTKVTKAEGNGGSGGGSNRDRKRKPARKRAPARPRNPVPGSGSASGPEVTPEPETETGDLTAEAEAFQIWLADPSISGSKLGPMVGVSDSAGRAWVRKWKAAEAARESARTETAEG